ncbi:hypothetical protein JQV27_20000 [Sulfitobacter mediterraneus]|uniref:hypothetical protein n=1 Tax=Sulfitobacter mediterraneus TaxID=83219 RepID=UPI00193356C8|nr:hypothetical protein [Sulfitobacter mediterraneus]MBM1635101.1 hypothetical protein [Sulfitobacter mediterraneus]MBM1642925.1 hypothetical protein [Sulfitobacter mediterraneus]MBM1646973.1 hypothetical protein [Sulfitobacter mediterraneus]MBM1651015.1 hypothetical protein [Sulfitobacter mediterraneus]MBM1655084.1 hypothetical protein [Sulfitobacter mediterraneus]
MAAAPLTSSPWLDAARAAKLEKVRALAAAPTPTQQDADKRLFLSQLKETHQRDDFVRYGWMSAINFEAIVEFWDKMGA